MDIPFEYDEIGYWSEIKLDIVKKYAAAYTAILSTKSAIQKYVYIDAFAGAGTNISRTTGKFVEGSPLNALNVTPAFSEIHLIDLDGGKAAELRRQAGFQKNVFVYEGDANRILLEKIFPRCRYQDFARALCLFDPYALNVDWTVIQAAGKMKTIEIFYNFMIMDANMNVLKHNRDTVADDQILRMDRAWGDRTWENIAYFKKPTLFGGSVDEKYSNEAVAEGFRKRLETVAGFTYVPRPVPMRNKKGAIIYYLFFASPNKTGAKIVEDIFSSYRTRGIS